MMLRVLLDQGFTAEPARKPAAFCRVLRVMVLAALIGQFMPQIMPMAGARAAEPDGAISRMLALVNAARAENGLTTLSLEPRLTAAACRQARDLSRGGRLTHQGRDGSDIGQRVTQSGYEFVMAAENLAAGAPTPDETVTLWLASPGHRRNILTAEFHHAGIAYQAAGQVWVLVFGAVRGDRERQIVQVLPQHALVNGC